MLRDSGQHLFALADFDKAVRFSYPDLARVYVAEAITYEKLRRTTDARDALNKALAANPAYEPAVQRLAILDGKQLPLLQIASATDQINTSTVTPAKHKLLAAQAPAASLLGGEAQAAAPEVTTAELDKKKFSDRVPVEVANAVPVSAPESEKILAVEDVPEDAPGQKAEEALADAAPTVVATAAAPTGETTADAGALTGWSVQLASAATEDAAWSTWKKMKSRHKALASKEPVVVRADLGKKGVFYRVRLVGFDNQDAASNACSRLKAKGVKCYISKIAS